MASILLIEPDHVLATIYKQALSSEGHEVTVRPSAQTAVMAADATNPALVIIELQLVEHSGIEFLYEFRSYTDWQNIPVIIHSHVPAHEFHDSQDILNNELGVTDYLYKPHTNLKQLLAAVDHRLAAIAV